MKVVIARPGRFSSTDKQTYQSLRREGIEVTVATELQSHAVNVTPLTFRHPDEILDLAPTIIDCPDLHFALTQYLASHLPDTTKLIVTSFDNLPGKNFDCMRYAPRVDLFIARSEMIRQSLWWDGIQADKIKLVNPGVDVGLFEPLPFIPKTRAVLFVGRLTPYKGIKDIIIAMKAVRAELWVVGGGDDMDKYAMWAQTFGVKLKFLGHLPHGEQLAQVYREAMIFCSPSYPVDDWDPFSAWTEQWGSAVMEAMASGLPVITTDIGSFPEFIQHGHNGYMIPARSWHTLHQHLTTLLGDAELREKMGWAGRQLMESKFSNKVIGEQLAETYLELASGNI